MPTPGPTAAITPVCSLAALRAAAAEGNTDAMYSVAMAYLIGGQVSRDVPKARTWLDRAARAGHVGALALQIALTANGSGGPADWRGALALLRIAAVATPAARRHLDLLAAMDLDADGAPRSLPATERLSGTPEVLRCRALLSADECAHVAGAVQDILAPSHIVDPATGRLREHPVRTSDGAVIGPTREDLVIRAINRRVAAISGTKVDQGEALSVLRYRPGQQFRLHHDAIGGVANQRIKTVLLYLNDGFQGGETTFPSAGLTIKPALGDAILFTNTLRDGRADPAANHAGLPVTGGVKWLATRWIRARPIDPWNLATAG